MADAMPAVPGAYALFLDLGDGREVVWVGRTRGVLAKGAYAYAGSARGPGGIAARVGRHLRTEKAQRWHVDQLTAVARITAVLAWPDGGECAIVRGLTELGGSVPVSGFGSSDCRQCAAHLLRLPAGVGPDDLSANLVGLSPPCGAGRRNGWPAAGPRAPG